MSLFDVMLASSTMSAWQPSEPPCLDQVDDIIIDLETTGLRWWDGDLPCGIGYCLPDGRTGYLPCGHTQGPNLDPAVVKRWAHDLRSKRITNHTTKFDYHSLYAWGVDLDAQGCTLADIAYDAALLNEYRQSYSLEALCEDFLPPEERKVQQVSGIALDPAHMAEYPSWMVADRAMADCRQVWKLKAIFDQKIAEESLNQVRALEYACIPAVCAMERRGAPINLELLHQWTHESQRRLQQWLREIALEVGFPIDPDRTADLIRLLRKLQIAIPHVTEKTGAPSVTDAFLATIDHPIVQKVRKAKKLSSLRAKYLTAYSECVGRDGILRYHLHQLRQDDYGTCSGRFSASDKNIQQVMDAERQEDAFESSDFLIRELFIAGEGEFLSADAKQEEFRLAADYMIRYANAKKIKAAYDANPELNYHLWVHEVLLKYKPDLTPKRAKVTNLARLYGAGRDKIATMLKLTPEESHEFVNLYNKTFPEIGLLHKEAMKRAGQRGFVRTMLGRRAHFSGPKDPKIHTALNRVIQGSGGDLMKMKILELWRAEKETGFLMRAPIHDEIIGDSVTPETPGKVRAILNRQSMRLHVPILWDVKTGANWAVC